MKQIKYMLPAVFVALMAPAITSCDDMLEMGNDDILYADKNHLTSANDTVNSYVGILAELQKIAVRTNLFGELRGDLVDVNTNANANLKEISNFSVSDDNTYNNPR
ncbi:MAG: RagB/SusD family nutrient uptake outer membrane protein, partial [Bacteroidales bacterium]|nr:RagB/SusD family nutrient uptake outer membrane protein [Bacteroidales bacterium]